MRRRRRTRREEEEEEKEEKEEEEGGERTCAWLIVRPVCREIAHHFIPTRANEHTRMNIHTRMPGGRDHRPVLQFRRLRAATGAPRTHARTYTHTHTHANARTWTKRHTRIHTRIHTHSSPRHSGTRAAEGRGPWRTVLSCTHTHACTHTYALGFLPLLFR